MPIGITEEHVALQEAVAGWAERHCPPAVPRALLEAGAEDLPPFWVELGAQGWAGLHVDEAHGGFRLRDRRARRRARGARPGGGAGPLPADRAGLGAARVRR